jgi:hypothetical protein
MANPDLTELSVRKRIIAEINGDDNKARREESLRRFEVYKQRQEKFIIDKLESEFSPKTVREMRKILSINLAPRIINQLASIYNTAPERTFGDDLSEQQVEQLNELYEYARVDNKMLQANRYLKLNDQVILQVVPRGGIPQVRVLLPHHVDVIPDEMQPELPYAYIISIFDKYDYLTSNSPTSVSKLNPYDATYSTTDGINQSIADQEDYKASLHRYEVWTKDFNFIMDGNGKVVSEDNINPIGKLPFVDVSCEKDFEFWIRSGNGIIDFAVDFGVQLSDIANIIRLQGYAQAIISSENEPSQICVGADKVIFLQLDPNRPEMKPSFEFANPGSDLQSGLDFLEMSLRLFLTSKGIDPKTISGKLDAQNFSSGVERLLSMVDKFEASKTDIELMRYAEEQVFQLLVEWSNIYQGTDNLIPDLQIATLPDDMDVTINYIKPEAIQTKIELEDSVIKLLDNGLITRQKALMSIYGLTEEQADEMESKISKDKSLLMPKAEVASGEAEIQ